MNTDNIANTYRPEPAEAPDPDQHPIGTITIALSEVAGLAGLLEELDEFLRTGRGIEGLAGFYRDHREDPGPRFSACCLVDQVGLTALGLRHRLRAAASDDQEVHQ